MDYSELREKAIELLDSCRVEYDPEKERAALASLESAEDAEK